MNPASTILVRAATTDDLAYIDSLQRRFTREVGWLARGAIEQYILKHHVSLALLNGDPAAYLLGRDTCSFDPSIGRIYQTAVQMDARQLDVGRELVSDYCARMPLSTLSIALYCAQDIQANLFWEALGFQAVGWRDGSRLKGRLHILWQRSARPDEDPLFVSVPETSNGGMMREQRIVTPLAAGQTWRDVKSPTLVFNQPKIVRERPHRLKPGRKSRNAATELVIIPKGKIAIVSCGRLKFRDKIQAHP